MRLPEPEVLEIIEIMYDKDNRIYVGEKNTKLGTVLRIEQETKDNYLVHYENHIERIHNVKMSLIKKK